MGNLERWRQSTRHSAGGCSRGLGEIPNRLGGFVDQQLTAGLSNETFLAAHP